MDSLGPLLNIAAATSPGVLAVLVLMWSRLGALTEAVKSLGTVQREQEDRMRGVELAVVALQAAPRHQTDPALRAFRGAGNVD
jgi:hypothetical protein